jgi:predicted metal-binding membrane protein
VTSVAGMSGMPGMPAMAMPNDAAAFLGMWIVMMAPMMLPSLLPTLWRSRQAALISVGYSAVWTLMGLVAFVLLKLPAIGHAAPLAGGLVMLGAGALQFTTWKAHHLACCRRAACECSRGDGLLKALQRGLRLGFHCTCCCAGSTAILLVGGLMDLRAMAIATVAITAERIAPSGRHAARLIGILVVGAGLWILVRTAA